MSQSVIEDLSRDQEKQELREDLLEYLDGSEIEVSRKSAGETALVVYDRVSPKSWEEADMRPGRFTFDMWDHYTWTGGLLGVPAAGLGTAAVGVATGEPAYIIASPVMAMGGSIPGIMAGMAAYPAQHGAGLIAGGAAGAAVGARNLAEDAIENAGYEIPDIEASTGEYELEDQLNGTQWTELVEELDENGDIVFYNESDLGTSIDQLSSIDVTDNIKVEARYGHEPASYQIEFHGKELEGIYEGPASQKEFEEMLGSIQSVNWR